MITNHLAEGLCRRFNRRVLMISASVLGCIITLFYACEPSFVPFLAARMLWGMCWSIFRQIGVMNSIDNATDGTLARVVGYYNAVVRLGYLAGMFFGGILFDIVGFRTTFMTLSLVSALGIPVGAIAFRGLTGSGERPGTSNKLTGIRRIGVTVRGFILGCVGPGVIMATLGLVLKSRIGDVALFGAAIGVATVNGFLLALRQVMSTAGSPVLGIVLDKIGRNKGGFISFTIATGALVCALVIPGMWGFLLSLLVFFICETTLTIALIAESGRLGSKQYAHLATAMDMGAAVGPLISWTAIEIISDPLMIFALCSILYAIGMIFSFMDVYSTRRDVLEKTSPQR